MAASPALEDQRPADDAPNEEVAALIGAVTEDVCPECCGEDVPCEVCGGRGWVQSAAGQQLASHILTRGLRVREQMASVATVLVAIERERSSGALSSEKAFRLMLQAHDVLRRLVEIDATPQRLPGAVAISFPGLGLDDPGDVLRIGSADSARRAEDFADADQDEGE